ncbi:MAG TPA: hypothetical protein VKB38_14675 [Terracidiphilus sp.]|nr:hypothetical protein [Terracidiphilus sp.]
MNNSMKGTFAIALLWIVTGAMCHAEPRWCSITSLGPGQNLVYPPIAKAARVQGHLMERAIYSPGGGATSFEYISGPRMLSEGLEKQMRDWTIQTSATGDAPCVTLVVADFVLDENAGQSTSKPIDLSVSSMLQLRVSAAPLIISDPAGEFVTKAPFLDRVGYAIRRRFRRLFGLQR